MSGVNTGDLKELLHTCRTIAVVGLSNDPGRPSYHVAHYLQLAGYRIIPVNPALPEILGEKCYPALRDIPEQVDIVDVFRKSDTVLPIAQEASEINARCLWLQEGVVNQLAADTALKAGLDVVMDRCILKEHQRIVTLRNGDA